MSDMFLLSTALAAQGRVSTLISSFDVGLLLHGNHDEFGSC